MHKLKTKNCYVYCLFSNGFVKVGITNNVDKRIKSLQTGCPTKITVFAIKKKQSRKLAKQLESEIHTELRAFRVMGEWFLFNETVQKAIVDKGFYPYVGDNSLFAGLLYRL